MLFAFRGCFCDENFRHASKNCSGDVSRLVCVAHHRGARVQIPRQCRRTSCRRHSSIDAGVQRAQRDGRISFVERPSFVLGGGARPGTRLRPFGARLIPAAGPATIAACSMSENHIAGAIVAILLVWTGRQRCSEEETQQTSAMRTRGRARSSGPERHSGLHA